jgi:phytoene synthase
MSRDTSFYYSFLVLPPRKRRAVVAVWDFCRAVDDAVDEVADGAVQDAVQEVRTGAVRAQECTGGLTPEARGRAAAQLAMWRAELATCYAPAASGKGPSTPQGRALVPFIHEFKLPRRPFEDLIDGVAMDLDQVRYPTFDALTEYCRRVASAVGLICIEIFGYRDPASREYAVDLGMALQLTNIIRDVAADLRQGRVYLPLEDLRRFEVSEDELRAGTVTPAVRRLLEFQCERARDYYGRAAARLPAVDARALLAAEIMGGIYSEILRRIERAGYDVFTGRIRVPRPYRAVIALRIGARTMLLRRS